MGVDLPLEGASQQQAALPEVVDHVAVARLYDEP